jgi:hypothetical protein
MQLYVPIVIRHNGYGEAEGEASELKIKPALGTPPRLAQY